jgi:hypothetical protein
MDFDLVNVDQPVDEPTQPVLVHVDTALATNCRIHCIPRKRRRRAMIFGRIPAGFNTVGFNGVSPPHHPNAAPAIAVAKAQAGNSPDQTPCPSLPNGSRAKCAPALSAFQYGSHRIRRAHRLPR